MKNFRLASAVALAAGLAVSSAAFAQKKYDTGATDTEIKIGQTILFPAPPPPTAQSARRKPRI
jgi:hypothetical protein